jgi:glycosyltransferase involved in cell wall biosynthesis
MIVRNEEQYLPYCLGCIYKYLDELIIVDTGSTDRTVEIAEGFCEHVPKSMVIHMEWKFDFSLARNIAQGGASGDCIIWLDGDEVLSDNGVLTVKKAVQDTDYDFWLLPRINFWKDLRHMAWYPDSQYKIYRNTGIRWKNNIHETVYQEEYRNRLSNLDAYIFHYAYVKDPETVAKKMQNYIRIENPDMDEGRIAECSTQHSFFGNEIPAGVELYRFGQYPEIFNRISVTSKTVMEKDGNVLVRFKGKQFRSVEISGMDNLNERFGKLKVSIVIATYNKLKYIRECILSIITHTKIPFELIVVDNGSTEDIKGFLDILKKKRDNITCIRFDENLGFSKGYNEGIAHATGDFILVLNNDTVFSPDFVVKLLDVYHERIPFGDAGLVGPVSNNNPSENGAVVAKPGTDFDGYLRIVKKNYETDGIKYIESSWMTGLCYLFHRDLLKELAQIERPKTQGLFFEERLVLYHNDTELNWRIHHRLKKKLWIAKTAFLWHYGQVTVNTLPAEEFERLKQESIHVLKELWPEIAGNMLF